MADRSKLIRFIFESNRIEGIYRDPTLEEREQSQILLEKNDLILADVISIQAVYAPNKPLRDQIGMDVQVGNYIAPRGGPAVRDRLLTLLGHIHDLDYSPWKCHLSFERLHPFMDGNGRTGRILWAWQMIAQDQAPFVRSFLHTFYYQTLEHKK